MPSIDPAGCIVPIDCMAKSLASAVLDTYLRSQPSNCQRPLTTIALGVPTYADVHIGCNHFRKDSIREYLQLRVFYVDYHYRSVRGPTPTVTEVATGVADDATMCVDQDFLNESYWLA